MNVTMARLLVLILYVASLASVVSAAEPLTRGLTEIGKMVTVVGSKVPLGTPVAKAKKFMESEGFKCSVTKNDSWRERERLDYIYCTRSEPAPGLAFVDRRWMVALIFRDGKIVEIDANTGLVGL